MTYPHISFFLDIAHLILSIIHIDLSKKFINRNNPSETLNTTLKVFGFGAFFLLFIEIIAILVYQPPGTMEMFWKMFAGCIVTLVMGIMGSVIHNRYSLQDRKQWQTVLRILYTFVCFYFLFFVCLALAVKGFNYTYHWFQNLKDPDLHKFAVVREV